MTLTESGPGGPEHAGRDGLLRLRRQQQPGSHRVPDVGVQCPWVGSFQVPRTGRTRRPTPTSSTWPCGKFRRRRQGPVGPSRHTAGRPAGHRDARRRDECPCPLQPPVCGVPGNRLPVRSARQHLGQPVSADHRVAVVLLGERLANVSQVDPNDQVPGAVRQRITDLQQPGRETVLPRSRSCSSISTRPYSKSSPTIGGVPPGWAVWNLITNDFLGADFTPACVRPGIPVLGYNFTLDAPQPTAMLQQLGRCHASALCCWTATVSRSSTPPRQS